MLKSLISGAKDLTHMLNLLPEPIFLLTKDGLYLQAWGGLDRTKHHPPSVSIGKTLWEIFSTEQADFFIVLY